MLLHLLVLKTFYVATATRLLSIIEYCGGFWLFTESFGGTD